MATLVLGAAGSAVGGVLGGQIGGLIGSGIGKIIGGGVDSIISGGGKLPERKGLRLQDLSVQTSTYGRVVPTVYGVMRVAGNVIWSRPIKETVTTSTSSAGGGKGGGGRISQSSTTYSYSITLAIALCEGVVDGVLRVWADSEVLNLSQGIYRFYRGDESQNPDPLIESFEGIGSTPAYRGLSYVVIEDFPLADYGNRIPNFTFEVRRKLLSPDYQGEAAEQMVREVIMIPGSGEFVYDTAINYKAGGELVGGGWAQNGLRIPVNMHNYKGISNALVALDDLKDTLPNLEWIGLVVTWFGDSLDAASCIIKPGVEYQTGARSEPEEWSVAVYSRSNARQITLIDDKPRYGGTPDDQSLLRLLDELRLRGYKIMFYPMIFMDMDGKPWRGQLTGTASAVADFFTKTEGYNAFINHYAALVAGRVDAFIIGSELIGLTKVSSSTGVYPAVNELVNLAASVKGTLGSSVKVTYAADWSEYHHTNGGWYNLDPLWASPNIDVVGIDAYFPLHDAPTSSYGLQTVIDGWNEGEGFDWYYTDAERTNKANLSAAYAWKNIEWWWNNQHYNPGGAASSWVPASKKIWFTEFGFASVDNAINQPNVFYDPDSVNGAFPRFSKGLPDILAQRQGIAGTLARWKNSTMIERKFLWTWDARPYPIWPDRADIWADGNLWRYGHWVNGKFGLSGLAAIVRDICIKAGLSDGQIDVSELNQPVEGYVILSPGSGRDALEELMRGFFFDCVESGDILKFKPRGQNQAMALDTVHMLPINDRAGAAETLKIVREQEADLPGVLSIMYYDRLRSYQTGKQDAARLTAHSRQAAVIDLPIVLSGQAARSLAEISIYNAWVERLKYSFSLPPQHLALQPTAVLTIRHGHFTHRARIVNVRLNVNLEAEIQAVAEDTAVYKISAPTAPAENSGSVPAAPSQAKTELRILDLPQLPNQDFGAAIHYAATGREVGWRGAAIYRSFDGGANYNLATSVSDTAVMGTAITALGTGRWEVYDLTGKVTIVLQSGALESVSETALLNGANLCLIGEEVLQFKNAVLLATNKYEISHLLRGRLGTETSVASHSAGENFTLLDGRITREQVANSLLGLPRLYKPVSIGDTLGQTASQEFNHKGRGLKPYAPVHIRGSRDGAGNLSLTWVRRSRGAPDLADYVDALLNEAKELYEIEILNGSSVVRIISGLSTPAATYTAAEQTADFGLSQSSITCRIYQLSEIVGRGYAAQGVV